MGRQFQNKQGTGEETDTVPNLFSGTVPLLYCPGHHDAYSDYEKHESGQMKCGSARPTSDSQVDDGLHVKWIISDKIMASPQEGQLLSSK